MPTNESLTETKLAACYDDYEHAVISQVSMGKSRESAKEIGYYLQDLKEGKEAKLSDENLIYLTPEMDVNVLPLKQKIFWKDCLPLWAKRKEQDPQQFPEWTLQQIQDKVGELGDAIRQE